MEIIRLLICISLAYILSLPIQTETSIYFVLYFWGIINISLTGLWAQALPLVHPLDEIPTKVIKTTF